ncbi:MAG: hypothetical protein PHP50_06960 [Lachnospiraceae bacterium]|nr:hypothetical protein [Lachnospiraceae bacterium]
MIAVYVGILIVLVLLLLLLGKQGESTKHGVEKYLDNTAEVILKKLICLSNENAFIRKTVKTYLFQNKTRRIMTFLVPEHMLDKAVFSHTVQKIKWFLLLLLLGDLLAVFIGFGKNGSIEDNNIISRGSYGEGNRDILLKAELTDGTVIGPIDITVGEQQYTTKELNTLYQKAVIELEDLILGENTSLDKVEYRLNFPGYITNYPFDISWECSDYSLLNSDGDFGNRAAPDCGEIMTLTATFRYYEFCAFREIPIKIYPQKITAKEKEEKDIKLLLEGKESKNRTETEFQLPNQWKGKLITWKEVQTDHGGLILILAIIAGCLISVAKEQELTTALEKRNQELLRDYPEIVSKLTLYMGAGLSIKGAFQKIGRDYEKNKQKTGKKQIVYEEIIYTNHAMETGTLEGKAFEEFGKRCGISCYIKCSALLVQNLSKGGNSLLFRLQEEVENAFENRKKNARKMGEEAGTKLLFPMLAMLCVVMIIILVPAFIGFSA